MNVLEKLNRTANIERGTMKSLNQIFAESRNGLVGEALEQLNTKKQVFVPSSDGKELKIDCRTLEIEAKDIDGNPIPRSPIWVLPLTDWGSGWEGIVPLGFSMANE